jgi:hypothetical protein
MFLLIADTGPIFFAHKNLNSKYGRCAGVGASAHEDTAGSGLK